MNPCDCFHAGTCTSYLRIGPSVCNRCSGECPPDETIKTSGPVESLEKNVNHPTRYTKGKVECIDALESAVIGKPPDEAICVANVIKYLWRYEDKEPLRSVKSAEWYLKRLITKLEAKEACA